MILRSLTCCAALCLALTGCSRSRTDHPQNEDLTGVTAQVRAAVQAFYAADTARSPEAVIALLWPEYTMLVDGQRIDYAQVVEGSRQFLPSLEIFHTDWTDLNIIPLNADAAIASFLFHDSIITRAGDTIRARGPTTFVWTRRAGEWRLLFGDADHYPIQP